jgi:hypothetical protein
MKVAVIEGHDIGGTCVNRGCVPSKALLAASGRIREMKNEMHMKSMGIQVTSSSSNCLQETCTDMCLETRLAVCGPADTYEAVLCARGPALITQQQQQQLRDATVMLFPLQAFRFVQCCSCLAYCVAGFLLPGWLCEL